MVVVLLLTIHMIFCIMYTFVFSVARLFALCFFFHLGIADSKQEEFQEGSGQIQSVITFVVKFALLCSLDNFC